MSEPHKESLLEEYRLLNDALWKRGGEAWLVISIMVPVAFVLLGQTIIYRANLGQTLVANLPVAGFIPLILLAFIIAPWWTLLTTNWINEIAYRRIHDIERALEIDGNRWLHDQISDHLWYKIRVSLWNAVFTLLILVDLFSSLWLFMHPV